VDADEALTKWLIFDHAVDLGPVTPPPVVVVAPMLHVHCCGGEHGVAGDELVELVVVHDSDTSERVFY
jgi:hypothetical protein